MRLYEFPIACPAIRLAPGRRSRTWRNTGSPTDVHILGISAFYHDSAAALVTDGRIVAGATSSFPMRWSASSTIEEVVGNLDQTVLSGVIVAAAQERLYAQIPMRRMRSPKFSPEVRASTFVQREGA